MTETPRHDVCVQAITPAPAISISGVDTSITVPDPVIKGLLSGPFSRSNMSVAAQGRNDLNPRASWNRGSPTIAFSAISHRRSRIGRK